MRGQALRVTGRVFFPLIHGTLFHQRASFQSRSKSSFLVYIIPVIGPCILACLSAAASRFLPLVGMTTFGSVLNERACFRGLAVYR